jgi:hypothetical protein
MNARDPHRQKWLIPFTKSHQCQVSSTLAMRQVVQWPYSAPPAVAPASAHSAGDRNAFAMACVVLTDVGGAAINACRSPQ